MELRGGARLRGQVPGSLYGRLDVARRWCLQTTRFLRVSRSLSFVETRGRSLGKRAGSLPCKSEQGVLRASLLKPETQKPVRADQRRRNVELGTGGHRMWSASRMLCSGKWRAAVCLPLRGDGRPARLLGDCPSLGRGQAVMPEEFRGPSWWRAGQLGGDLCPPPWMAEQPRRFVTDQCGRVPAGS